MFAAVTQAAIQLSMWTTMAFSAASFTVQAHTLLLSFLSQAFAFDASQASTSDVF